MTSDDSYFSCCKLVIFSIIKSMSNNLNFISWCFIRFHMQSSSLSFTEHLHRVVVNDCHLLIPEKKNKEKDKNAMRIKGGHEEYLSFETRYLRWHVTTWQVGVVASVANITAHNVVAVVAFRDLIVRIYSDLWRKTICTVYIYIYKNIWINNTATKINKQHRFSSHFQRDSTQVQLF